jgi:hypothetical protein
MRPGVVGQISRWAPSRHAARQARRGYASHLPPRKGRVTPGGTALLLPLTVMITQTKQQDCHNAAPSTLGSVGTHCAVRGRSGDDKRSQPGRAGVRSRTAVRTSRWAGVRSRTAVRTRRWAGVLRLSTDTGLLDFRSGSPWNCPRGREPPSSLSSRRPPPLARPRSPRSWRRVRLAATESSRPRPTPSWRDCGMT